MIGVHPNTFYLTCERINGIPFSQYAQEKRAEGDDHLRMAQYNLAMKGDKTMLIWLGKNRLGQPENENRRQPLSVKGGGGTTAVRTGPEPSLFQTTPFQHTNRVNDTVGGRSGRKGEEG
jgi:hypothetical protein